MTQCIAMGSNVYLFKYPKKLQPMQMKKSSQDHVTYVERNFKIIVIAVEPSVKTSTMANVATNVFVAT